MFSLLSKFIGGQASYTAQITAINALEHEFEGLSDEDLGSKSKEFKERLKAGETLDELLPEAFAAVRESAKRTLKQRHFDVQLMGGMALHQGGIAEMATGEGKTLAATSPVYLNALRGEGVHVVTVNEYLAKRDTVLMGQVYHALGLTVGCLVHEGALLYDPDWQIKKSEDSLIDKERDTTGVFRVQEEYLRPISRREAYATDITYGTNHEFGFDYLRDNLGYALENQVQRGHSFAIIDEADSILIDEARTPLIIAAPDAQSSEFYKVFARVVKKLEKDTDYAVDEKMRTVAITDNGITKAENMTGIKNIYSPENFRLVHYLEESLKAEALYQRDKDYVVKDGEVIIVDQFTGRLMLGRRFSAGLHQAIEAKEGVRVKEESQTYARVSIQNYFRLYKKLAGMTGTAQTSAEEFHKVYNLEVISIPTNKPMVRKDLPDIIYKTLDEKYLAVAADVRKRYEAGQPVLLGTPSIEKNEIVSRILKKEGVPHEVLNAKNNEREGAIIAQAGHSGAVTVATNVAGRGVDIILGGNPPDIEDAKKVKDLGGLHVIGTDRHEARRIDNQLRGRSGRQGDPGSSQFFLSLEDDLIRIFGGDRVRRLMETMNVPDGTPIESGFLSKAVSQAQAKVEGLNFDSRKHLLEYDDVLNRQRGDFYKKRQELLTTMAKDELASKIEDAALTESGRLISQFFAQTAEARPPMDVLKNLLTEVRIVNDQAALDEIITKISDSPPESAQIELKEFLAAQIKNRAYEATSDGAIVPRLLSILDMLWMTHLENMEGLSESVRLRAYAQHDPLVEYRREGHRLYEELFANFGGWIFMNLFRSLGNEGGSNSPQGGIQIISAPASREYKDVGRNDPCPCGSGKKYKKCHGKGN